MPSLYSIRDWAEHFEVSQTRKVEHVRWVPVPVKHDGLSFRRLMATEGGLEIFGAWVLILQVAGKCKVRGVLKTAYGDPMTAADIAAMTGATEIQISNSLEVLCSKAVGWIDVSESNQLDLESNHMVLQDITGEDITGEEKRSVPPEGGCPPELVRLIGWWNDLKSQALVKTGVSADPPSDAVRKGWTRVQTSALLREKLANLERLTDSIRRAPLCRDGWFRLEKLMGGKNRDGEYILVKLLEGGYEDSKNERASTRVGPGQRYRGDE